MCCLLQLAWNPCQLETLVRSAVPFILQADWEAPGEKEMLLLQVTLSGGSLLCIAAALQSDSVGCISAELDHFVLPRLLCRAINP